MLVLIGVFFAMWRRGRDRGALAVQQFANDLLPLVMLFAVSVTGLFLTVSTHLMRGLHFVFLSQLHAVTVIFTLLYLPFGKFFHIFQRPAQLGVAFYAGRREGRAGSVRALRPSLRVADAHRRSEISGGGSRDSVSDGRRPALSGRLSALPPQESRADAGRALEALTKGI